MANKAFFVCLISSMWLLSNGRHIDDWRDLLLELEVELETLVRNDRTLPEEDSSLTTFQRYGLQKQSVTIAAFNIQIFGDTKYDKKDVVEVLIKILKRYDLILVQEIRDRSGDAFISLVNDLIEESQKDWKFVIGERLGRSDSKEQYAYLYRGDLMSLKDVFTYDDSAHDYFEREPYCSKFHIFDAAIQDIGFIGIHTKPDEAGKEVDRLVDVYDEVAERFQTENIILMGDFNADCSYIGKNEWPSVRLRSDEKFLWLIGDGIDTTTKSSDCAYDRFVVAGKDLQNAIDKKSVEIFHYNEEYGLSKELTKEVSDHFPIQLDIVGKISDDVLDAISVSHSINIHCDTQVSKRELAAFAGQTNPANFDLKVFKAGRGIRSATAEQNNVADVTQALKDLQEEFPSLMSDSVIATAQSFVETKVLEETPKVLGYPAIESSLYNIKIVYQGKALTYDVTISKKVA